MLHPVNYNTNVSLINTVPLWPIWIIMRSQREPAISCFMQTPAGFEQYHISCDAFRLQSVGMRLETHLSRKASYLLLRFLKIETLK